jgi:hypothetical protein
VALLRDLPVVLLPDLLWNLPMDQQVDPLLDQLTDPHWDLLLKLPLDQLLDPPVVLRLQTDGYPGDQQQGDFHV